MVPSRFICTVYTLNRNEINAFALVFEGFVLFLRRFYFISVFFNFNLMISPKFTLIVFIICTEDRLTLYH